MSNPPADRDVWIDFLRVLCVAIVVAGHWVTTTVIWEPDQVGIENALSVIRSSHPVTWLIQVMPLMFFVGGFSNYRSLERHDGSALAFLHTRYGRLLPPTLVFIAVWTVIGFITAAARPTLPNPIDRAADLAALPFWFLGLYVIVVALAPAMVHVHRRFGWWAPAAMVGGAALVDVAHHGLGIDHIGTLNFAFVWLLAHQLGFFYADGRLQELPRRTVATVTGAALAAMVLLTTVAGYPVSMVGVPGDERWNTNPPSLGLVALTFWLVGLMVLLRPRIAALLAEGPRRAKLKSLNSIVLTAFLWHVSALAGAATILYSFGMPKPATGTGSWWLQRPVWIIVSAGVLWVLATLFRRFEVHPVPEASPATGTGSGAVLAVVSIGLALLGFGVTGFNRITEALGEGLLGFELNPLMSLVHLGVGLVLLVSMRRWPAGIARLMAGVAAGFYLALWLAGYRTGIELLGTNEEMAVLHLFVGVAGVAAMGWNLARVRQ